MISGLIVVVECVVLFILAIPLILIVSAVCYKLSDTGQKSVREVHIIRKAR